MSGSPSGPGSPTGSEDSKLGASDGPTLARDGACDFEDAVVRAAGAARKRRSDRTRIYQGTEAKPVSMTVLPKVEPGPDEPPHRGRLARRPPRLSTPRRRIRTPTP